MSSTDTPRRRTWPQRLVLALGVLVVLGCGAAGAATGYFGLRFSQIDRVQNIALQAVEKGEPQNFLVVGTDSREGISEDDPDAAGITGGGEQGCNCTDTIMIVRVDPNTTTASVLSLPRDLWVPIAGTKGKARINSAYQHGEQALIDTIENNFGIPIHHYFEIDFVGFERLVDAVGGIPLYFDVPVRDTHIGLSVPNPGCQTLDGESARKFARSRYLQYKGDDGKWHSDGTADFGRITRQQIFIRRAIDKAVAQGLGNPVTLNNLVSAGVQNVRLDDALDAGDLLGLGRKFKSFDSKQLISYALPSDSYTTSAGAAVQLPRTREAEPILNIFRGLPPGALSPAAIDVTVLNGSGVPSLAADAAGALQGLGFVIDDVDDYPPPTVATTSVLYGVGGEDAARTLGRYITGGAPLLYDDDVDPGAVVVVIGSSFTTIHDQIAPEGSADDLQTTTSTTTAVGGVAGDPTTSTAPTTTTTVRGYATGEPPEGVTCG